MVQDLKAQVNHFINLKKIYKSQKLQILKKFVGLNIKKSYFWISEAKFGLDKLNQY